MWKLLFLFLLFAASCTKPTFESENLRIELQELPTIMHPVLLHLYNTTDIKREQKNIEKERISALLVYAAKNNITLKMLRYGLIYDLISVNEETYKTNHVEKLYYAWLLTPLNALPNQSNDVRIYWELGEAFASLDNFEQAIAFYTASLETNPYNNTVPYILCDLSRLYISYAVYDNRIKKHEYFPESNNPFLEKAGELEERAVGISKMGCCYPLWAVTSYTRSDYAQALHDLEHAEHFKCGRLLSDEKIRKVKEWEQKQRGLK